MAGNYYPSFTVTWSNAGWSGGNFQNDTANFQNNTVIVSNTITQTNKLATEVAVSAIMPGSAGAGLTFYLLKERPDGSFQSITNNDPTWAFTLPLTTSTYFGQTFTVDGQETPRFQVGVKNLCTVNVVGNVWVSYRQAVGAYT